MQRKTKLSAKIDEILMTFHAILQLQKLFDQTFNILISLLAAIPKMTQSHKHHLLYF
jgi:hypothetical protein